MASKRYIDEICEYLTFAETERFLSNLRREQRLGQAFFNALDPSAQKILRGTLFDPFYDEHPEGVFEALNRLTRP